MQLKSKVSKQCWKRLNSNVSSKVEEDDSPSIDEVNHHFQALNNGNVMPEDSEGQFKYRAANAAVG